MSRDPCLPSPCGPNADCRNVAGVASCACQKDYFGSPPYCKPECTINSECSSNLACIRHKCQDPCLGCCGIQARCHVINHMPICSCSEGYTGDPFTVCNPKPAISKGFFYLRLNIIYYYYYFFIILS